MSAFVMVRPEGRSKLPPVEELQEEELVEDTGAKWYEQLFHKTKEWFETEPDTDF